MKEHRFFAHTPQKLLSRDKSIWHPLEDHLKDVSKIANELAIKTKDDPLFAKSAEQAGLIHDFGKYSDDFQELLIKTSEGGLPYKVKHAIYGANIALRRLKNIAMSMAIVAHHSGLKNMDVFDDIKSYDNKFDSIVQNAISDGFNPTLEEIECPLINPKDGIQMLKFDLWVRMLLSVLVDADRLDTTKYSEDRTQTPVVLNAKELLGKLLAATDILEKNCKVDTVRQARKLVRQRCLEGASIDSRLLSLIVPTGGSKTLSSMAFALKRASLIPGIQRIIVVIPYLTVIEQNARVLKEILGYDVVFEHHSGEHQNFQIKTKKHKGVERAVVCPLDVREEWSKQKVQAENWDAPIIITTSVRFFESLFSNHPNDLRRIHNIANSIVIFDEVQVIDRSFLSPLLDMMKSLSEDWNTHFLFCTATKPSFEASKRSQNEFRWPKGTITPVISVDDQRWLFNSLRRVKREWVGMLEPSELVDRLAEEHQTFCVVNTKKTALLLYSKLKEQLKLEPNIFHLSTNMCPAHRLHMFDMLKGKLSQRERCLVISTQLIEAGVDIDFPVGFRENGPMDSMRQAEGRIDREGILTNRAGEPAGRSYIFSLKDSKIPPGNYENATEITKTMVSSGIKDIDNPEVIEAYFNNYYSPTNCNQDIKNIQALRKRLNFAEVADEFYVIGSKTISILVHYNEESDELIDKIVTEGEMTKQLYMQTRQHQVSLYAPQFQTARELGAIYSVGIDTSGVWVCHKSCYDPDLGFLLKAPSPNDNIV